MIAVSRVRVTPKVVHLHYTRHAARRSLRPRKQIVKLVNELSAPIQLETLNSHRPSPAGPTTRLRQGGVPL
jgi:hypothetical protein